MRKINLLVLIFIPCSRIYASSNKLYRPPMFLENTNLGIPTTFSSTNIENFTPNHISFFYYKNIFIIKVPRLSLIDDFPENLIKSISFFQTDPETGEYSSDNDILSNSERYKHHLNICTNAELDGSSAVEFVLRKDVKQTEEDKESINKFINYLKKLGEDGILMRLVEDGFI